MALAGPTRQQTGRSLRVTPLASFPEGEHVCGIAHLADNVYLVRTKQQRIEVYNAEDFTLVDHVPVGALVYPSDMAACPQFNSLLIIDSLDTTNTNSKIFRIELPSGSSLTWTVGEGVECIASTSVGTTIVACCMVAKVKEYTIEGRWIRTIKLHPDLLVPWHAILLSNGDIMISHGATDEMIHRVCRVAAADGSLPSLSYGDKEGDEKLKTPLHVAVSSRGFVFVTDTHNGRVAVLDSKLRFLRHILYGTDDGNEALTPPPGENVDGKTGDVELKPSNVCLDELRGRLYVSFNAFLQQDSSINRVKAFNITV